jgi:hypothetical protein
VSRVNIVKRIKIDGLWKMLSIPRNAKGNCDWNAIATVAAMSNGTWAAVRTMGVQGFSAKREQSGEHGNHAGSLGNATSGYAPYSKSTMIGPPAAKP